MLTINIPDELQNKLANFAILAGQTTEQAVLEIIEERIDHESAYNETEYLMKSEVNKKRLDKSINEIRKGIYEEKALIND